MPVHPPGTRLGPFEIVSYAVEGEVTVDYVCLDRERKCPALLRALRPELQPSPTARESFAQCGAAWVSLGAHPHIVRCLDVFKPEDSDEVFLVQPPVVPGKERGTPSLVAWLSPGQPLPVLQALLFALQIARGMRYIGGKAPGFIHGDLKPESVLVGGGRLSQADVNRVRVTDFGLAGVLRAAGVDASGSLSIEQAEVGQLQWINGVAGTPLYMAPERWSGAEGGTATDVYALGCLLYNMLTGQHPVKGKNAQELRQAHCAGNVLRLPPDLPGGVRDLTARCLALKPEERYQSWEEMETAIAEAYKGTIHFPVPVEEPADVPTASERQIEGWGLNAMGCATSEVGNVNTAVECLELARETGDREGDPALVAAATTNLGEAFRRLGDTQRAIGSHEQALALAVNAGDRSAEGMSLNNLGVAYLQLGNPRRAVEYLERALVIAREIGNRKVEMGILVNMGSVYHQLGDLPHAIRSHEQVLDIARKAGDRHTESKVLGNLGGIYSELGDNARAIQYQEQSLEIKSSMGDRQAQFTSLNNLANAYRNLGQAERAFGYYKQAIEIARAMGDRRGEAFALNNIGSTYANLGHMEQALEHHEKALKIFREVGDKKSQGDCLTNLGFIYNCRYDTARAMQYCEEALAIDREVGDRFGLALDEFNMANLLEQQGRFSEALAYAEQAAGILEQVGHTAKASEARQVVGRLKNSIRNSTGH